MSREGSTSKPDFAICVDISDSMVHKEDTSLIINLRRAFFLFVAVWLLGRLLTLATGYQYTYTSTDFPFAETVGVVFGAGVFWGIIRHVPGKVAIAAMIIADFALFGLLVYLQQRLGQNSFQPAEVTVWKAAAMAIGFFIACESVRRYQASVPPAVRYAQQASQTGN